MSFKVGDRVWVKPEYKGSLCIDPTDVGRVVHDDEISLQFVVDFGRDVNGHSGDGRGTKYGCGWFTADELIFVDAPSVAADAPAPSGMSLRDWFAGMASDEDIREYQLRFLNQDGEIVQTFTREQARYRFADAMLAERERGE